MRPSSGERSVSGLHQVDAVHADVEFLGGDLGEAGQRALAVLHLADGDADDAGGSNPTQRSRRGLAARLGGEAHAALAVSRMRSAASATAAMMRLCAPQRQRCQASASAMSARLGLGLRSSSAFAPTRMPARQ